MPIVNGSFAYKQILTTMLSIIQKHNFTMPNDYSLTVISYLNGFEYNDLEIERKFFTANPNLGQLYNKVIAGSLIPPPQNDSQLIKSIVEGYTDPIDDLPNLMKFIRGQLTQIKPVLIYTHCEAGTDRTGEVSGAYYMTYLNMTFTQALDVDNHVQSRDM
jgi:protein-tyrosine phosphatase